MGSSPKSCRSQTHPLLIRGYGICFSEIPTFMMGTKKRQRGVQGNTNERLGELNLESANRVPRRNPTTRPGMALEFRRRENAAKLPKDLSAGKTKIAACTSNTTTGAKNSL